MGIRSHRQKPPLNWLDTLVVEDEELVARTFVGLLNALGIYKLRMATSVNEALIAIRFRPPDVVLLDVGLRGMPAHEVVTELENLSIPFVVVTGYRREMLPEAFLAAPLLRKPIILTDLEKSLRTLIAS